MDDRRVFARMAAKFPLRFLDSRSGREGKAETVDISANGLGFLTNNSLDVSTPLEIWLDIPDSHEPLYTRGEVAWTKSAVDTNQQHVGVQLEKAQLMGLARALWIKR